MRRAVHSKRERDPARLDGVDRIVVAACIAAMVLGAIALFLAWGTL